MQRMLCFMFLIPFSVSLMAQTNTSYSIVPLPSGAGDGHAQVRLSNEGTSAIEAFKFIYSCPSFQMAVTRDPLLHFEAVAPILPGASRVIAVGGLTKECTIRESAVIFLDGSASGDASCITSIYDHRAALEEELTTERNPLIKAVNGTIGEGALIRYFAEQKENIGKNIQLSQGARLGHLAVVRKLQASLSPSGPLTGAGRPVSSLVAPSLAERAQTTLRMVDEWRLRIEQEMNSKDQGN